MARNDFGMHVVRDDTEEIPVIPAADAELRDFGEVGEAEPLPDEDVEAEEHVAFEDHDFGTPDAAQPETQGEEPLVAAIGDDGQGDLAPEDLASDDAGGAADEEE